MRRALVLAALASLASSVAMAHPVRIGRYAEIPYGIRPDHPHPTAGGGPRRDGRIRGRVPLERPERAWERALPHRRPRGPTIANDTTLYFGTEQGLVALNAEGEERWTARLGSIPGAPSLTPSDDVAVVTREGLVALVSPEGVVRRSTSLGAPARGSPLVLDDGSVLVGTIDQRVHRLDASLRPVFVTELSDGTASTLSRTRRGSLAVAAGRLLVLLTPRGSLARQVGLGGRATSPPAVGDDGMIWITTAEGVLLSVDEGGRVRSRTELGARHYDEASVAIGHDGAVRVPTLSGGLVCVAGDGTPRWVMESPNGFQAPAAIDENDTTLVIDRGGRLFAVDRDGAELWRLVLGTFSYESPVLGADGTLYVSTERGALQAWRPMPARPTPPPP
ncbi:MAG: PQQ-binding-like beta-propeller repeat protein [Sandaracinaceae bacterium]|nr:PQQ-binding-like beta-propeller repeat protein [Sandaracinaceae bacterium]